VTMAGQASTEDEPSATDPAAPCSSFRRVTFALIGFTGAQFNTAVP
jgi:hypothetical protein